jgi:hypothetical protein
MKLTLVLEVVLLLSSSMGIGAQDIAPLPKLSSPYRLVYGYKDHADFKPKGFRSYREQWDQSWEEVFQHFNIITGRTADVSMIKRLRGDGKVFACHVSNNRDAKNKTAENFTTEWSKPFEETLKSQLPGGFDAISIDELQGDVDDSADSEIAFKALSFFAFYRANFERLSTVNALLDKYYLPFR